MSAIPTLEALYRPVDGLLAEVRESMHALWQDVLQLVKVDFEEAPNFGGKLLRPALCLLSAGAGGIDNPRRFAPLAAAYEALHVASLAHDDVIDRALLRRGGVSLNALWNDHAAVLAGDYLVARAIEMMGEYESCTLILDGLAAIRRMAEGELHFFGRDHDAVTEADCILLAQSKTASLFEVACSAPAKLEAHPLAEDLGRYGLQLGVAFQIVDDLLDVTQPSDSLGKPSCGDVGEGKQTIPLIYLREALDAGGRERLTALQSSDICDADRAWIMESMDKTGARERTAARAREFGKAALMELGRLPDNTYRDSLEQLTEFVLVRIS